MQSEKTNQLTASDLSDLQEKIDEAEVYLTQGLFTEARQIFQQLLNTLRPSPEDAAADPVLRRAYESRREFVQEQLAIIERQEAEFHGHPADIQPDKPATEPESEGDAAFNRGQAFLDIGLFSEAIREFERAAKLGCQPIECSLLIGKAHIQLGNHQDGIRILEKAYNGKDLSGEHRQLFLGQMAMAYEAAGDKDRALELNQCPVAANEPKHSPAARERERLIKESRPNQLNRETHAQAPLTSQGKALLRLEVDAKLQYQILEKLGQDEIHQTFRVSEIPSGTIRIAKTLLPDFSDETRVKEFIINWAQEQVAMENRNITRVLDVAESEGHHYLIMEDFECTLEDVLQEETKLTLTEAVQLAKALLNSMAYAHSHRGTDDVLRKIFHLALNPRRVLINGSFTHAKVADFGLITQLSSVLRIALNYQDLSPYELAYMAPEQFERSPDRMLAKMKQATDLYSFGVVFYKVITGKLPFEGPSPEEFRQQHNEQYPVPPRVFISSIPPILDEAVLRCMHKDPKRRWRTPTELDLALDRIHV